MLSVATATLGSIIALKLCNMPLDIYCQLGLLMLIGLTAKTAILMVEFSKQERENGLSIYDAAMSGMKVRFRSVMMTALSFVIGVAPLVIATGAGAGSRQAIGVTTFWGMLVATVCGMMLIPGLYVIFQNLGGVVHHPDTGAHLIVLLRTGAGGGVCGRIFQNLPADDAAGFFPELPGKLLHQGIQRFLGGIIRSIVTV